MVLSHQKASILQCFFHSFCSCVFKPRCHQKPPFDRQSANLCSKVGFWTDFRIGGGPKIDPWGSIFAKKGSQKSGFFVGRAAWGRPRRYSASKTVPGPIFLDFCGPGEGPKIRRTRVPSVLSFRTGVKPAGEALVLPPLRRRRW